jgi:hypothetical protein
MVLRSNLPLVAQTILPLSIYPSTFVKINAIVALSVLGKKLLENKTQFKVIIIFIDKC